MTISTATLELQATPSNTSRRVYEVPVCNMNFGDILNTKVLEESRDEIAHLYTRAIFQALNEGYTKDQEVIVVTPSAINEVDPTFIKHIENVMGIKIINVTHADIENKFTFYKLLKNLSDEKKDFELKLKVVYYSNNLTPNSLITLNKLQEAVENTNDDRDDKRRILPIQMEVIDLNQDQIKENNLPAYYANSKVQFVETMDVLKIKTIPDRQIVKLEYGEDKKVSNKENIKQQLKSLFGNAEKIVCQLDLSGGGFGTEFLTINQVDYYVDQRLDELAGEDGGRPRSPGFIAAPMINIKDGPGVSFKVIAEDEVVSVENIIITGQILDPVSKACVGVKSFHGLPEKQQLYIETVARKFGEYIYNNFGYTGYSNLDFALHNLGNEYNITKVDGDSVYYDQVDKTYYRLEVVESNSRLTAGNTGKMLQYNLLKKHNLKVETNTFDHYLIPQGWTTNQVLDYLKQNGFTIFDINQKETSLGVLPQTCTNPIKDEISLIMVGSGDEEVTAMYSRAKNLLENERIRLLITNNDKSCLEKIKSKHNIDEVQAELIKEFINCYADENTIPAKISNFMNIKNLVDKKLHSGSLSEGEFIKIMNLISVNRKNVLELLARK